MGFKRNSLCRVKDKSLNFFPTKLVNFSRSINVSGVALPIFLRSGVSISETKLTTVLRRCTPSITSHVPSELVAINNDGTGMPKNKDSTSRD